MSREIVDLVSSLDQSSSEVICIDGDGGSPAAPPLPLNNDKKQQPSYYSRHDVGNDDGQDDDAATVLDNNPTPGSLGGINSADGVWRKLLQAHKDFQDHLSVRDQQFSAEHLHHNTYQLQNSDNKNRTVISSSSSSNNVGSAAATSCMVFSTAPDKQLQQQQNFTATPTAWAVPSVRLLCEVLAPWFPLVRQLPQSFLREVLEDTAEYAAACFAVLSAETAGKSNGNNNSTTNQSSRVLWSTRLPVPSPHSALHGASNRIALFEQFHTWIESYATKKQLQEIASKNRSETASALSSSSSSSNTNNSSKRPPLRRQRTNDDDDAETLSVHEADAEKKKAALLDGDDDEPDCKNNNAEDKKKKNNDNDDDDDEDVLLGIKKKTNQSTSSSSSTANSPSSSSKTKKKREQQQSEDATASSLLGTFQDADGRRVSTRQMEREKKERLLQIEAEEIRRKQKGYFPHPESFDSTPMVTKTGSFSAAGNSSVGGGGGALELFQASMPVEGDITNLVVLGGATGAGTTAFVHQLASFFNVRVAEINTSVRRNSASLEKLVAEATQAKSLNMKKMNTTTAAVAFGKMGAAAAANKKKDEPVDIVSDDDDDVVVEEGKGKNKKKAPAKKAAAKKAPVTTQAMINNFFAPRPKPTAKKTEAAPPPPAVVSKPAISDNKNKVQQQQPPPPQQQKQKVKPEGKPSLFDSDSSSDDSGASSSSSSDDDDDEVRGLHTIVLMEAADIVMDDEGGFCAALKKLADSAQCPVIATASAATAKDLASSLGGVPCSVLDPAAGLASALSAATTAKLVEAVSRARAEERSAAEDAAAAQTRLQSTKQKQQEASKKGYAQLLAAARHDANQTIAGAVHNITQVLVCFAILSSEMEAFVTKKMGGGIAAAGTGTATVQNKNNNIINHDRCCFGVGERSSLCNVLCAVAEWIWRRQSTVGGELRSDALVHDWRSLLHSLQWVTIAAFSLARQQQQQRIDDGANGGGDVSCDQRRQRITSFCIDTICESLRGSTFRREAAAGTTNEPRHSSLQNTPARPAAESVTEGSAGQKQQQPQNGDVDAEALLLQQQQQQQQQQQRQLVAALSFASSSSDSFVGAAALAGEQYALSKQVGSAAAGAAETNSGSGGGGGGGKRASTTIRLPDGATRLSNAVGAGTRQPPQWLRPYAARDGGCVFEVESYLPLTKLVKK